MWDKFGMGLISTQVYMFTILISLLSYPSSLLTPLHLSLSLFLSTPSPFSGSVPHEIIVTGVTTYGRGRVNASRYTLKGNATKCSQFILRECFTWRQLLCRRKLMRDIHCRSVPHTTVRLLLRGATNTDY